MRQKITRDIIKTVKIRSDKSLEVIDSVVSNMWEFVAMKMKESKTNAIYLRYLGTFYGNERMADKITERTKLKEDQDDSGEFQGE